MSLELHTLRAEPCAVAALVELHAAAPPRVRPGYGALLAVHTHLCDRYRDGRGYVDETVDQIATATGLGAGPIRRALQLLDRPDWWPVIRRGGSAGRGFSTATGSRREAAWQRALFVDNLGSTARLARGASSEAARAFTEAARATTRSSARSGARLPDPVDIPAGSTARFSPWADVDDDGYAVAAEPQPAPPAAKRKQPRTLTEWDARLSELIG